MNLEALKNKKIAILGFSVEGLSVAKFLDRRGISFTILEREPLESLAEDAQGFIRSHNYSFISGPDHLKSLDRYQAISRSQGIPLWLSEIIEAKTKGVVLTSMTKLFFDFCPCPIIGVTGTKGKGTTATLIYEMLKASGQDVFLGGNIGQSPLDFIDDLKPKSKVVLELSSFQLEDLEKSPQMAVVLMVTQEHLNTQSPRSPNYHQSLGMYLEAKKNIVRLQTSGDVAVINQDFENSRFIGEASMGQKYFISTKKVTQHSAYVSGDWLVACLDTVCLRLCQKSEVLLRGEHNLQNVLAAATAALVLKADLGKIIEVIKTFKGLEHRLEFIREVNGAKYYNDSFSTTPETAIAAIKSFTEPEILILGGSEKGSDYTELGRIIAGTSNLKATILIGMTAYKIKMAIEQAEIGFDPKIRSNPEKRSDLILVEEIRTMVEIVKKAGELSRPGDVVILSPACASFDMFKDYKDRGEQFKKEVTNL